MNIIELLTPAQKKTIRYRNLKKNETLFHENDECRHIGIIIKGQVSIISYPDEGGMLIYNTIRQDEIFANNLLFSSRPCYKGNIIADQDTTVALIGKEDLLALFKENNSFLSEYLKISGDNTIKLNERLRLLSMRNGKQRFLYYLYINDNEIAYDSISSLAEKLQLSREALSRLISSLEKENKLSRDNKVIRLL